MEPAHAYVLIGPQRAVKGRAGIDARQRFRAAQRLEHAGQPWPGDGPRPFAVVVGRRSAGARLDASQQAHRVGERQAAIGGGAIDAPELVDQAAQPIAIDLHPTSAQQRQTVHALEERANLVRRQRLAVQRHVHPEVEQRVEAEPPRRLGADRS